MAPGGADPCHDGGPGVLFHCPVTAPGFLGVTRTDSATYVVTARGGGGIAGQVWGGYQQVSRIVMTVPCPPLFHGTAFSIRNGDRHGLHGTQYVSSVRRFSTVLRYAILR